MKTSLLNKCARTAALAVMLSVVLLVTDSLTTTMRPKPEGWILVALTAAFVISEVFFWKAIESVTDLPKGPGISSAETEALSARVQNLKRRLINRWFILLTLKAVAAACALFLTNQDVPGGDQRLFWLVGVAAIAMSLPIALSFFRNWEQADSIKSKQIVDAKRRTEEETAADALAQSPAKPFKADKVLSNYTNVIRATKSGPPKH